MPLPAELQITPGLLPGPWSYGLLGSVSGLIEVMMGMVIMLFMMIIIMIDDRLSDDDSLP